MGIIPSYNAMWCLEYHFFLKKEVLKASFKLVTLVVSARLMSLIMSEKVLVPCYLLAPEAFPTMKGETTLLCNSRQLLVFTWKKDITY